MRFLAFLCAIFGVIYIAIVAHYLSFNHQEREQNLENLAKNVQDTRLSTSFVSASYKGFVYAK